MGIISWIVLGLIAGALAKWLMPGKDGGGLILTTLLGIGGAMVGGYIGSFIGLGSTSGFNIATILTATAGAFLILFAYRLIRQTDKGKDAGDA
ncbi:MAG: GlsB/YeaQ/YmgE family stress response membrane protein [gamma proteobacterium symbiont of Ctena orbiculata]|nr:GlsB/YeaQ/YmgE family stress response membrane protein [Candidatus Thiodiazotropha taylori]MBT3058898.1 GlsB/YeaQ/YmgE family stress response membrane protein [Candidatus Thiodiazotropha sp. (ex Lucina pensylvanica)]MBV2096070.1 GlsB/YeaQ/YmgE family stress response membrane protein [Candidatus Thiodiazotropha sp. (ex Codakia orbicularis)]PUB75784.1 MAG: GlsB/YeaQ/YmgE family stress response membrane protein [gamma proteobacterium symbiont of Ctena orbiculata]MBT3063113.1 GlsB/YeaQ/YmgE fami